jgi:hypothetical protein
MFGLCLKEFEHISMLRKKSICSKCCTMEKFIPHAACDFDYVKSKLLILEPLAKLNVLGELIAGTGKIKGRGCPFLA